MQVTSGKCVPEANVKVKLSLDIVGHVTIVKIRGERVVMALPVVLFTITSRDSIAQAPPR